MGSAEPSMGVRAPERPERPSRFGQLPASCAGVSFAIQGHVTLRALVFLSLAAVFCACGGGSKDPPLDMPPDGGDMVPDAGPIQPAACNPALQVGCTPGEKCAAVSAGSGTPTTSCVPNGTVLAGQACTVGSNGADDCVAGYH